MSRLWNVHGRTESGDEWDLQFVGKEEPSCDRINYVYAQEFPEEWAYQPEPHVDSVEEVSAVDAHPSDGPTLNIGEELPS